MNAQGRKGAWTVRRTKCYYESITNSLTDIMKQTINKFNIRL